MDAALGAIRQSYSADFSIKPAGCYSSSAPLPFLITVRHEGTGGLRTTKWTNDREGRRDADLHKKISIDMRGKRREEERRRKEEAGRRKHYPLTASPPLFFVHGAYSFISFCPFPLPSYSSFTRPAISRRSPHMSRVLLIVLSWRKSNADVFLEASLVQSKESSSDLQRYTHANEYWEVF